MGIASGPQSLGSASTSPDLARSSRMASTSSCRNFPERIAVSTMSLPRSSDGDIGVLPLSPSAARAASDGFEGTNIRAKTRSAISSAIPGLITSDGRRAGTGWFFSASDRTRESISFRDDSRSATCFYGDPFCQIGNATLINRIDPDIKRQRVPDTPFASRSRILLLPTYRGDRSGIRAT